MPHTRNCRPTLWTPSVAHGVSENGVPVAFDQQHVARRTIRILEWPHAPREIAGIDEVESGVDADVSGPQKTLGAGVIAIPHFVVLMEGGHMPWDLR